MTYILMSDDQVRQIAEGEGPIVLVDMQGREVGKLVPLPADAPPYISDAELQELKHRVECARNGEFGYVTTRELLSNLRAVAPE